MIDQSELPKTPEPKLTPEEVTKSDRDLITLATLTAYAEEQGAVLEVGGGYAVEAYFGGRITRPHGDMDAVLWLPDLNYEDQIRANITNILRSEQTQTNWEERPNIKDRKHFIEFIEEKPDNPDDINLTSQEKFLKLRRLELYIFNKNRMRHTLEKSLFDSKGNEFKIQVPLLEQMVASKVQIFNRTPEQKSNKRETRQNDIDDFNKLINHRDFNIAKYMELRAGALREDNSNLDFTQSIELAQEQFQKAIQLTSANLA